MLITQSTCLQKAAEDKKDKDVAKKVKQEGNKLTALEVELRELERRCVHLLISLAHPLLKRLVATLIRQASY